MLELIRPHKDMESIERFGCFAIIHLMKILSIVIQHLRICLKGDHKSAKCTSRKANHFFTSLWVSIPSPSCRPQNHCWQTQITYTSLQTHYLPLPNQRLEWIALIQIMCKFLHKIFRTFNLRRKIIT